MTVERGLAKRMCAMDENYQGGVSVALDDMVCGLIEDMLDEFAAGSDPGVVLCCEDVHGNRYQAAFSEDGPEACLNGAKRFVENNAAGIPSDHVGQLDRYAIAYAGAVEIEEGSFEDALIVSFYERGMECGYSAYVLYEGFGSEEDFMWSEPEPAGEEPALL